MDQITRVDLLRHGKICTENLLCAHPEEALSEAGRQALWTATQNGHWDMIISSPYRRCASFAQALAEKTHTELHIDPAFGELDFGDWTGQDLTELMANNAEAFHTLWQDPEHFSAPGGESMQAFIQRVSKGWNRLLRNQAGKSVLLITHSGVIRALLAQTLQITAAQVLSFSLDYAHLSRLHYYPDGVYALKCLNCASLDGRQ